MSCLCPCQQYPFTQDITSSRLPLFIHLSKAINYSFISLRLYQRHNKFTISPTIFSNGTLRNFQAKYEKVGELALKEDSLSWKKIFNKFRSCHLPLYQILFSPWSFVVKCFYILMLMIIISKILWPFYLFCPKILPTINWCFLKTNPFLNS